MGKRWAQQAITPRCFLRLKVYHRRERCGRVGSADLIIFGLIVELVLVIISFGGRIAGGCRLE